MWSQLYIQSILSRFRTRCKSLREATRQINEPVPWHHVSCSALPPTSCPSNLSCLVKGISHPLHFATLHCWLGKERANQLFKIWIKFALHNDMEELSEEEKSFIVWHNYFFNMCVSWFRMGPMLQTQLFTSTLRGTVTQEYSHGFNVMLTLKRIIQETKTETSKVYQFHMGALTDTQT